ncbi:MAG: DUF4366 domain-containing protein [Eubacteriales bacterium]|nr:DUF4366 domain-containing protein [Eubacteriales bacterium]
MDKLNTLISLNETKKTIDEMIEKIKQGEEEISEKLSDNRKLVIIILSVIGALVVIGIIAFAVYKYFSNDDLDDFDGLFDDDEDDEDYAYLDIDDEENDGEDK